MHHMLRFGTQGLLVDSQNFQLTYQEDELKSPYCGAVICKACYSSFARQRSDASSILIVDTEVMLHQVHFCSGRRFTEDVLFLFVMMRKNSFFFYSEHYRDAYVKEKVEESPNDRTDRAIRVSAHWYQSHLAGRIQILLITNNGESKRNAIEESLSSETVESYVRSLQQPISLDLVAIPTSLDILKGELDDQNIAYEATTNWKRSFNTHDPLDIGIYPIRAVDQMIEEFMLACNFSIAEIILKHFPLCFLLRCAMLVLRGI